MIWMIFVEILKNTIQKKHKTLFVFDNTITDMLSNNKLNPTVSN